MMSAPVMRPTTENNGTTYELNYITVDVKEETLLFTVMILSMITVTSLCLSKWEIHVRKQKQFYKKLLSITETFNFEGNLNETYSMLIDKYFMYNALSSVDQLLVQTNGVQKEAIQAPGISVSVDQLRSKIQLIQKSENLPKSGLVQNVSDLCMYVESFHHLNASSHRKIPELNEDEVKKEDTNIENRIPDENCMGKITYEITNDYRIPQANDETFCIKKTSKMSLQIQNNTGSMSHFKNSCENIDKTTDEDTVKIDDRVEVIKTQSQNNLIPNDQVKGKVFLKKPYDAKKIKCKKHFPIQKRNEMAKEIICSKFIDTQYVDVQPRNDKKIKPTHIKPINKDSLEKSNTGTQNDQRQSLYGNELLDGCKASQKSVKKTDVPPMSPGAIRESKKSTNEEIKKRLERGYTKLRKGSEHSRIECVDIL